MIDLKALLDVPPWEWPRGAGKRFHDTLTNPQANAADRLAAAELAGDFTVINDQLAEDLMAVLRNPGETDQIRAKSAISFGAALEQGYVFEFDDPEDVPISEEAFEKIQDLLHALYFDDKVPKLVKRRILEASVRAPQDWHPDAIQAAYASGDREWVLTAVFAMRWVPGFDDQILEALKTKDSEIHYEAVKAAGAKGVSAAWPHVTALVNNAATPKPLLIAAIAAAGNIRPKEAGQVLLDLAESEDEDIADAADEAISLAQSTPDDEEAEVEDEDGEDEWLN
jgi:hypothetical protein